MFSRQLRWLITLFCIAMRARVCVTHEEKIRNICQSFRWGAKGHMYNLRVHETVYIIDYGIWFIPNLVRSVYVATVERIVDGDTSEIFTKAYPSLSIDLLREVIDPMHALAVVANLHLENFFEGMKMKMLNGLYQLELNCAEFDIVLNSLIDKVQASPGAEFNGVAAVTVQQFKDSLDPGQFFIVDDEGTQVVGVGVKTRDLSRVFVVPVQDHKHALFIDGVVEVVEELGFIYERSTGHIISPYNNNKIILDGKAYL